MMLMDQEEERILLLQVESLEWVELPEHQEGQPNLVSDGTLILY